MHPHIHGEEAAEREDRPLSEEDAATQRSEIGGCGGAGALRRSRPFVQRVTVSVAETASPL
jgi:hypothetical protein